MYAKSTRAQNLRQGIVIKTSFETQVSGMGLGSFVAGYQYFCHEIFFIQLLHILHFSRISNIKIYKMLRPQKETREFPLTILFKFRAQNCNSHFSGSKCTSMTSGVDWCFNGFHDYNITKDFIFVQHIELNINCPRYDN